MKGLSKEVKSAIIIGIVIVLPLVLGIIYGQKEKTEVADTPTTTVTEVADETTTAAATTAAPETTTSANVTVPAGATVAQDANGNWALMNNGATVNTFTGIAQNEYGNWYIENGVVNFNFSGKVVFNGVTYDIENGKVVS
ncbi:MAG: hypothetical protein IJ241_03330 [Clostridia bacterium]|nr:hypothetical protein [Clostridia bacterium]